MIQVLAALFISEEQATYIGVNSDYDFVWYFGYGNRFIGLLGNANAVAVQGCVALSFLIGFLIYGSRTGKRILSFNLFTAPYLILVVGVILLTGVRAALLSILIVGLYAFVYALSKQKLRMVVASGFAVTIFILYGSSVGVFDVLSERLGESDGRIHVWLYYIENLALNPLGYGLTFENVIDVTNIEEQYMTSPHPT